MSIPYLIIIIGLLLVPISIIALLVSPKKNKQTSCPNCNQKISNGETYCTNCGQNIKQII